MKNGGKNKSVAFIILFSVYIYMCVYVCVSVCVCVCVVGVCVYLSTDTCLQ